jgi:hypothetical protein
MKYTSAAAFRQALDQRLKNEAASSGLGVGRLRKRVAFELFLRRLLVVAPDRWVLKGALALDFRLAITTRATKDIDLGREDDEQAAIHDITAAQQLALDDFFTFAATKADELDGTDEFSAIRFHVTAQLAGRTFEQFLIDIAFTDSNSWKPDMIQTSDLLSFAGIEPLTLPAIPLSQHLAEKAHAYTRSYGRSGLPSTRPKDLIDILLIERSTTTKPPPCDTHSRLPSASVPSSPCPRASGHHRRRGPLRTGDWLKQWISSPISPPHTAAPPLPRPRTLRDGRRTMEFAAPGMRAAGQMTAGDRPIC